MPIYVYGCQECGAVEEHIQRFSDPPLTECSSCGGRLEKQVTSAAFQLKGGGWYKDGYASAQSDTKSDTKSDAKSDTKSGKGTDKGGSDSGSSGSSSSGSSSSSSPSSAAAE
ncbi:FmdB family zinc ribbon protein [Paraliomyxa miuraensis]|uniref:FmdB family zinc ribbon protein n=1 Tax=Paraliomyxa miuraensis TaxID=376150 RepID=UPI002259C8B8|nr:FmdB family zinc ribbon protein [Paraliomyxa miuraensis]MCX4242365.1 zinc ribbon domain-containing protein [Paraliomyxa miuraensis]